MDKLNKFFYLVSGFILFLYFSWRHSWHKLFATAHSQNNSFACKSASSLLNSSLCRAFIGNEYVEKYGHLDRQPPERLAFLDKDEVFNKYGSEIFKENKLPLENQQRGRILPFLINIINDFHKENNRWPTVIEIGHGNGDVLAFLSDKFKDVQFLGLDFKIKSAEELHGGKANLKFSNGYPLDVLEACQQNFDIAFMSSCSIKFFPGELKNYIKQFKLLRIKHILLSEPTWYGYHRHIGRDGVSSMYMNSDNWFHNYPQYFKFFDFNTKIVQCFKLREEYDPGDVYINIIHATRINN